MTSGTTPIGSMEEFIRALDEHPEWLDAVRSRVLGERTAELLDNAANTLDRINGRLTRVEEIQVEQTRGLDALAARVDTLTTRVDALTDKVDTLAETVRDLVGAVQTLSDRLGVYERRTERDLGIIKGHMMKTVAREEAADIADILNLRYVATLSVPQLRDMTDSYGDTSDIAPGDLASFRRADLIAEAVDRNGDACYVAAEASFVVSKRDTDRAVRNAEYLTRFTGKPAYPAVAGVFLHESVQQLVLSGAIPCHTITEEELTGE